MSKMQTDILIIGGGLAGLTMACLLGQIGLHIAVIDPIKQEPGKKIEPTSRTVALMQSSINILKAANAFEDCLQYSSPLETMRIIDDSRNNSDDTVRLEFNAHEIGLDVFGYNIPNTALMSSLATRISSLENVEYIAPATLKNYELEGNKVKATTDNSLEISSNLIIGADGKKSLTREIAGIECQSKNYGQQAITCLIEHEQPHNNVSTEFHRSGGPFALVPLPENRSSIVWVEKDEDAQAIMSLGKDGFAKALQERTNNLLGQTSLILGPHSWPLGWLKAKSLTAPRCAILAESAHAFTPLGAQGLNLSLRDIAALAETIADAARLGQDIGSKTTLDKYESRRRADVYSRIAGVNTLNRMISNDMGLMHNLRRMGLKTLDNVTPLKRFAMHQGLAPDMDESRLAQGEDL
jgi:2-octaprenyl-6-methoxyphenol hydroxylase